MKYVKFLFLSNNKLKLAYVDSIAQDQMQSKSSKCHHFTMENFNARLGLQFVFWTLQKVKLTWQKCISMVKWQY